MKYAVKNSDETFSGVTYNELNSNIKAHHNGYGQTLVAVHDIAKNEDGTYSEVVTETPSDSELKFKGVEIEGVMCSATSKDMYGLSSVRDWVLSGQDVNFEFDNGNKLLLTSSNVAAFEAIWIPFRASFF